MPSVQHVFIYILLFNANLVGTIWYVEKKWVNLVQLVSCFGFVNDDRKFNQPYFPEIHARVKFEMHVAKI